MAKKIIDLIRVSTEEQAKDYKAGIQRQETANELTIKRHELEKVEKIVIKDVSGTDVCRCPEMIKLITMMTSKSIDGVVVANVDRLIRPDNYDDYSLLQRFKDNGILLYTPDQVYDFNTQSGFLMGGIRTTMAGNELTDIKIRLMGGKEEKRKQGKHPGSKINLPLGVGYNYDKKTNTGGFYYDEDSIKVKKAFELFIKGSSFREIERETGIHHASVPNLLRNETFIGNRVYADKLSSIKIPGKKWKKKVKRDQPLRVNVIKNGLINEATFNTVQTLINNKKQHFRTRRIAGDAERFWLHGFLYCGKCHQPMYTYWTKRRSELRGDHRDDYYYCKTLKKCFRKSLPKCDSTWVKRDIVTQNVEVFITEILGDKDHLYNLLSQHIKKVSNIDELKYNAKQLQDKLVGVQNKKGRLLDLYVDSTFSKDELNVRANAFDKEIDINEKLLNDIQQKQKVAANSVDKRMINSIARTLSEFQYLAHNEKRSILLTMVPKIYVIDGEISAISFTGKNATVSNGLHIFLRNVPIEPHFAMKNEPKPLNRFGVESKSFYLTRDVCKLLGISQNLYYYRVQRGCYPRVATRGRIRIFTEEDIAGILQWKGYPKPSRQGSTALEN